MSTAVLWYGATVGSAFVWLLGSAWGPRMSIGELLAAAITVGTVGGAWAVYLTACASGNLWAETIYVATALMLLAAYLRARDCLRGWRGMLAQWQSRGAGRVVTPLDDVLAWAVTLALGVPVAATYWHRMLPQDEHGNILAGGSCYGDLPIHMTLAQSFLVGVNQRIGWGSAMMSPIFAGEPLTYPFLPDFHAAVLVRLGASMRTAFLLPGLALALALFALLYYLTLRVTRSRVGGVLAILLTVCAGGMGGPRWLAEQGWAVAMDRDVVQHDTTGEWKFLWFAFLPHILLPQRGGNFAYPLSVLAVLLVWVATDANVRLPSTVRASLLLHAAVFSAALPLLQAHAFMGVGIIIATLFVFDAHKWLADARLAIGWALAGFVTLALGYPQMAQFQKTASQGFYGKFIEVGWLFNNYEFGQPGGVTGFYRFWWYSLGPTIHLFTLACAAFAVEATSAWLRYAVGNAGKPTMTGHLSGPPVSDTTALGTSDDSDADLTAAGVAARGASATARTRMGAAGAEVRQRRRGAAALAQAATAHVTLGDSDADSASDGVSLAEPGVAAAPIPCEHDRRHPLYQLHAAAAAAGIEGAVGSSALRGCIEAIYTHALMPTLSWLRADKLAAAVGLPRLDAAISPANALSPTGRALDGLKLAVGGWLVFLLGNFVRLQPWDRDNAKL
jgi:hypothetical protein